MLWTWLRRLVGKRDAFGYTAGEREIFDYWDGSRVRLGDPLAIHRSLMTMPESEFDIKIDPDMTKLPNVKGLEATGRVVAAVRRAFKIPDLDHGGLTDGECMRLFCAFGDVIRELEDRNRPLASLSRPMGAAAGGGPTTAHSSASGSTAGGPAVQTPAT
jgi:hypothetical protein